MSESSSGDYLTLIQEGREIVQKINKDVNLDPGDYLTLIVIILTLITSILNGKKLAYLTKSNILAYLNNDNIKNVLYIENLLEKLLLLTNSSRICVGLFHNGTSIGSYSFKKMSIIYEAKRSDTKSIKNNYKDVELARLYKHLAKVNTDNFTFSSRDDDSLDKECIQYLDFLNLTAVYSILLSDSKGVYGILEIQYLDKNKYNVETFEDSSILEERDILFNKISKSISFIVNNKKIPDI